MNEPRVERLSALFEQVLSIPREQRAELVRQVCGDDAALRRELESLLDAERSAAEYFDDLADGIVSPAYAALANAETVGPRWEGRRVGAYRLVREVGRGGMSRVFLAERADGEFEQQVALKLLRPGFDSDVDVMRFRGERQILASLSHPNIARLLDGGVTDDALPYLVLEHIDGVPVDRYCESHDLAARARLELFVTIANAVEYAHRNSVVHRDLKPSNILVTSDGTVKLLDFGVAKLLEDGAPSTRPTTRTGHRWMTPEYAAPEQIRGQPITARTDVYQLGAVLYELLTGRTPFCHSGETIHELERAILEQDPDSLGRMLGGDLDAIVLKALRKNADERFASASEFADDVRRYLTGRPVRARQTFGYLTRRFAHRNRFRVAAAAGVVLVLGTAVIVVGVEEARAHRALAEVTSRVGVADSVPEFVNALLALSSADRLPDTGAARALVERGLAYARAAPRQPQRQAQVLEAAGNVQAKLHELDSSFALLQEALVIRRRLADTRRAREQPRAGGSSIASIAPNPKRRPLLFTRPPGIVYMVEEDGSHEVRITDPNENSDAPAWAPDGRRILFGHPIGVAPGIYLVNPDGTDPTQVTATPPGWNDGFAVAFGDHAIVFARSDTVIHRGMIYRVNVDGTGLSRLTFGPREWDDEPTPSPNGDFIVFHGDGDIYRRDLRSGAETRLTNTPSQYKGVGGVSPDGRKILFTRIDPGRYEQIFVMNVDGTHVTRVSRGDYYDFLPRWSPDGKRIAFTSSRDGTNGVYTMNADGSDLRDVSRTPLTLAMRPGIVVTQVNESLWAWR